MAKTYEAFLKAKEPFGQDGVDSLCSVSEFNSTSKWFCADLLHTKHIADLRQKLKFYAQTAGFRSFHFANSQPGEGTSTLIVNLAKYIAMEKTFDNILLIDANFPNAVLHRAFSISSTPGLRDVLANNSDCMQGIHHGPSCAFDILPCGSPPSGNCRGIDQKKFQDQISILRSRYQCILIDSSPVLACADSLSTALCADVTFLVVQACKTNWEVVERSKLLLQEHGCTVAGVILNRMQKAIPDWLYKKL